MGGPQRSWPQVWARWPNGLAVTFGFQVWLTSCLVSIPLSGRVYARIQLPCFPLFLEMNTVLPLLQQRLWLANSVVIKSLVHCFLNLLFQWCFFLLNRLIQKVKTLGYILGNPLLKCFYPYPFFHFLLFKMLQESWGFYSCPFKIHFPESSQRRFDGIFFRLSRRILIYISSWVCHGLNWSTLTWFYFKSIQDFFLCAHKLATTVLRTLQNQCKGNLSNLDGFFK